MLKHWEFIAALLVVLASAAYFGSRGESAGERTLIFERPREAGGDLLAGWPPQARRATQAMLAKYGPPADVRADAVLWRGAGPWEAVVVYRDAASAPLVQMVGFCPPARTVGAILLFGHGLGIDMPHRKLWAQGASEALNFLALNLAHEIAAGKKSAGQAGRFYAETVGEALQGRSSPYLEGLLFNDPTGKTVDLDPRPRF